MMIESVAHGSYHHTCVSRAGWDLGISSLAGIDAGKTHLLCLGAWLRIATDFDDP